MYIYYIINMELLDNNKQLNVDVLSTRVEFNNKSMNKMIKKLNSLNSKCINYVNLNKESSDIYIYDIELINNFNKLINELCITQDNLFNNKYNDDEYFQMREKRDQLIKTLYVDSLQLLNNEIKEYNNMSSLSSKISNCVHNISSLVVEIYYIRELIVGILDKRDKIVLNVNNV